MSKAAPSTGIETFANPQPGRDYTIRMRIPEFTCLCPRTGQPDFATLELEYVPDGPLQCARLLLHYGCRRAPTGGLGRAPVGQPPLTAFRALQATIQGTGPRGGEGYNPALD